MIVASIVMSALLFCLTDFTIIHPRGECRYKSGDKRYSSVNVLYGHFYAFV